MKISLVNPTLEPTDVSLGAIRVVLTTISQMFQRIANAINNPDFGVTAARPTTQLTVGQFYFDTSLGKPIWWRGGAWVDGSGAVV